MQDPIQGQPEPQPAPAQQGGPAQPEPAELAPAQPESLAQSGQPDAARHFQSLADQRYAENLRLQKELFDLRMQMQSQPQTQVREPEPDPATDWAGWIRWSNRQLARQVKDDTRAEVMEQFQRMVSTAQEAAWQQKHPQVDIATVKAFAAARGIRELDDALALLEMDARMQQVTQGVAQSAFQQFRQPQSQAQPLRNTQAAAAQPQLRFDTLAEEFQRTNGMAYNSWPPEVRAAFDREASLREAIRAANARQR